MTIQEVGGTQQDRRRRRRGGHARCCRPSTRATRETLPASELMLALQCGGSDGYSGITANPALGVAADILVRNGGTAILSETPEIYGAEHLLTRRAKNQRGRREADRDHPLVGGLHRPQQHGDEQQPVARQQARRPDDHPRKVARRGGQGRLDHAQRRLSLCRAGHREGLRLHGHARLRPGRGDRPGRRRRQHPRLHHRPRLGLWLQADAVHQARHQHADVRAHGRRHGHQLRRRARRRHARRTRARRSSTRSSPSPPARRPSPKSSATATTNSCPGRSAPPCSRPAARSSRPCGCRQSAASQSARPSTGPRIDTTRQPASRHRRGHPGNRQPR